MDQIDEEGTTVRAGAKTLQLLGFISEYRWATNIDQVIDTLLEVGPVVVGTNWYEGMDGPTMQVSGELLGGHAYLLSGVDVLRKTFRVKNSWGRAWANNGRSTMPFTTFKQLLSYNGEACLGVERKNLV